MVRLAVIAVGHRRQLGVQHQANEALDGADHQQAEDEDPQDSHFGL